MFKTKNNEDRIPQNIDDERSFNECKFFKFFWCPIGFSDRAADKVKGFQVWPNFDDKFPVIIWYLSKFNSKN